MGKIQGQPFGLVVSKTPQEALTESVKAGNEAKFYVHNTDSVLDGAVSDGAGDGSKACEITINGNVLRGMSKAEQAKLDQFLNVDPATVYKFKGTVKSYDDLLKVGSVKAGDVWNVIDPTSEGYPGNTNFAATKDGKGSDMHIWDSLGGFLAISTASNINLVNGTSIDSATADCFDYVSLSANTKGKRNNSADAIELVAQYPITINKGTFHGTPVAVLNLHLSTGLTYDNNYNLTLSSKVIQGKYIKNTSYSNDETHQIFTGAPFIIDDEKLDINISSLANAKINSYLGNVIDAQFITEGDMITPYFTIKLATNESKSTTDSFQDAVPGLLRINNVSLFTESENKRGLYVSKSGLIDFIEQNSRQVGSGLHIDDNTISITNPYEVENISQYSLSTKSIVVEDNNYIALKIASKYVDTALNNNDVAKDPKVNNNILKACNNGLYISSNALANFVQDLIDKALAAK